MTAHEGVRFLLSVGNGLGAVPIQPGQKTGNGTQAVPYRVRFVICETANNRAIRESPLRGGMQIIGCNLLHTRL